MERALSGGGLPELSPGNSGLPALTVQSATRSGTISATASQNLLQSTAPPPPSSCSISSALPQPTTSGNNSAKRAETSVLLASATASAPARSAPVLTPSPPSLASLPDSPSQRVQRIRYEDQVRLVTSRGEKRGEQQQQQQQQKLPDGATAGAFFGFSFGAGDFEPVAAGGATTASSSSLTEDSSLQQTAAPPNPLSEFQQQVHERGSDLCQDESAGSMKKSGPSSLGGSGFLGHSLGQQSSTSGASPHNASIGRRRGSFAPPAAFLNTNEDTTFGVWTETLGASNNAAIHAAIASVAALEATDPEKAAVAREKMKVTFVMSQSSSGNILVGQQQQQQQQQTQSRGQTPSAAAAAAAAAAFSPVTSPMPQMASAQYSIASSFGQRLTTNYSGPFNPPLLTSPESGMPLQPSISGMSVGGGGFNVRVDSTMGTPGFSSAVSSFGGASFSRCFTPRGIEEPTCILEDDLGNTEREQLLAMHPAHNLLYSVSRIPSINAAHEIERVKVLIQKLDEVDDDKITAFHDDDHGWCIVQSAFGTIKHVADESGTGGPIPLKEYAAAGMTEEDDDSSASAGSGSGSHTNAGAGAAAAGQASGGHSNSSSSHAGTPHDSDGEGTEEGDGDDHNNDDDSQSSAADDAARIAAAAAANIKAEMARRENQQRAAMESSSAGANVASAAGGPIPHSTSSTLSGLFRKRTREPVRLEKLTAFMSRVKMPLEDRSFYVAHCLRQILQKLDKMHTTAKICYFNLKPHNVLIGSDSRVHLANLAHRENICDLNEQQQEIKDKWETKADIVCLAMLAVQLLVNAGWEDDDMLAPLEQTRLNAPYFKDRHTSVLRWLRKKTKSQQNPHQTIAEREIDEAAKVVSSSREIERFFSTFFCLTLRSDPEAIPDARVLIDFLDHCFEGVKSLKKIATLHERRAKILLQSGGANSAPSFDKSHGPHNSKKKTQTQTQDDDDDDSPATGMPDGGTHTFDDGAQEHNQQQHSASSFAGRGQSNSITADSMAGSMHQQESFCGPSLSGQLGRQDPKMLAASTVHNLKYAAAGGGGGMFQAFSYDGAVVEEEVLNVITADGQPSSKNSGSKSGIGAAANESAARPQLDPEIEDFFRVINDEPAAAATETTVEETAAVANINKQSDPEIEAFFAAIDNVSKEEEKQQPHEQQQQQQPLREEEQEQLQQAEAAGLQPSLSSQILPPGAAAMALSTNGSRRLSDLPPLVAPEPGSAATGYLATLIAKEASLGGNPSNDFSSGLEPLQQPSSSHPLASGNFDDDDDGVSSERIGGGVGASSEVGEDFMDDLYFADGAAAKDLINQGVTVRQVQAPSAAASAGSAGSTNFMMDTNPLSNPLYNQSRGFGAGEMFAEVRVGYGDGDAAAAEDGGMGEVAATDTMWAEASGLPEPPSKEEIERAQKALLVVRQHQQQQQQNQSGGESGLGVMRTASSCLDPATLQRNQQNNDPAAAAAAVGAGGVMETVYNNLSVDEFFAVIDYSEAQKKSSGSSSDEVENFFKMIDGGGNGSGDYDDDGVCSDPGGGFGLEHNIDEAEERVRQQAGVNMDEITSAQELGFLLGQPPLRTACGPEMFTGQDDTKVFLSLDLDQHRQIALKHVANQRSGDLAKKRVKKLQLEADHQRMLTKKVSEGSRYVARLYGARRSTREKCFLLYMEFVHGATLESLRKKFRFSEVQLRKMVEELLMALQHLHEPSVVAEDSDDETAEGNIDPGRAEQPAISAEIQRQRDSIAKQQVEREQRVQEQMGMQQAASTTVDNNNNNSDDATFTGTVSELISTRGPEAAPAAAAAAAAGGPRRQSTASTMEPPAHSGSTADANSSSQRSEMKSSSDVGDGEAKPREQQQQQQQQEGKNSNTFEKEQQRRNAAAAKFCCAMLDFKANNIILQPNGSIKLIDLGESREMLQDPETGEWVMNAKEDKEAGPGGWVPYFTAPEVILNEMNRPDSSISSSGLGTKSGLKRAFGEQDGQKKYRVTQKADIWSLGATLLALITNQMPFRSNPQFKSFSEPQVRPVVANIVADLPDDNSFDPIFHCYMPNLRPDAPLPPAPGGGAAASNVLSTGTWAGGGSPGGLSRAASMAALTSIGLESPQAQEHGFLTREQVRALDNELKQVSELCLDFIRCCMQVDPKKRPSASELRQHAWFSAMVPVPILSVPRNRRLSSMVVVATKLEQWSRPASSGAGMLSGTKEGSAAEE